MDYGFEHRGKVYTPNATAVDPARNEERNAALEAAELARWASRPASMIGYVAGTRTRFTTWRGTDLGEVEITATWRRYSRHKGCYTMTAIKVRGTNGATYRGTYGSDWSQACRVKRSTR